MRRAGGAKGGGLPEVPVDEELISEVTALMPGSSVSDPAVQL